MHSTKAQAMQRSFSLSLSLLSLLSLFLSFHLFSSSDKRWLRKILSKAMNWSLPKNKNFPAILNAHDTHTDSVGFLLVFLRFARSIIWCIPLFGGRGCRAGETCHWNVSTLFWWFCFSAPAGLAWEDATDFEGGRPQKVFPCVSGHRGKEQRNKWTHLVWKTGCMNPNAGEFIQFQSRSEVLGMFWCWLRLQTTWGPHVNSQPCELLLLWPTSTSRSSCFSHPDPSLVLSTLGCSHKTWRWSGVCVRPTASHLYNSTRVINLQETLHLGTPSHLEIKSGIKPSGFCTEHETHCSTDQRAANESATDCN